ncbi:hypothetical protein JOF41_002039 [Saccharothrix coeruleofusca]|uniref:hypothetical protein n=1 Tax=Saccharothrix coeruleofusca TaxID=33919 RepID=UPI001AE30528|nr:hypothetical protein [Saccharothrix coeruleofusca]MBP2335861.1 hypothetical protein [Saccharothrix coeruleofusca]
MGSGRRTRCRAEAAPWPPALARRAWCAFGTPAGSCATHTPSPSIARWSNALEYAVPISVVPIAGSVLGVYQAVLDAVG